jgi:hypothetical protein
LVLPVSASDGSAAGASPSALPFAGEPLPPTASAFLADRFGLAPGAGAFAARR